jgi:hypothetical protein
MVILIYLNMSAFSSKHSIYDRNLRYKAKLLYQLAASYRTSKTSSERTCIQNYLNTHQHELNNLFIIRKQKLSAEKKKE